LHPSQHSPSQSKNTAVVIFAKYPKAGYSKTRLTKSTVPELGPITPEQSAELYHAFLQDYIHRFQQEVLDCETFFCVRPGPDFSLFEQTYATSNIQVVEEPTHQGQRAADIGQAMSFTIRHFLTLGYQKVIILGSDLPHFPTEIIREAQKKLDAAPLVLGNDGGGCYLVSASEPPTLFEQGLIVWSQGEDFATICRLQKERGKEVGVLERELQDIDTPEDLHKLILQLQMETSLQKDIPHTSQILHHWGWLKSDTSQK